MAFFTEKSRIGGDLNHKIAGGSVFKQKNRGGRAVCNQKIPGINGFKPKKRGGGKGGFKQKKLRAGTLFKANKMREGAIFSENRRQRHLKQKIAGGHDSKPKNRMWGRLLTKTASGAVFAPKSRVWRWLETEKSHVEAFLSKVVDGGGFLPKIRG